MTVVVLIHLPNLWGFLMIQPCSLFWMILPHTSHIFLQWYVSLVGAVTIFCIWMFPKRKKCASTSVVIELPLVLLSSTVNLWNRLIILYIILDEKLSFTEHVTAVQKKSQQRLHVLRQLRAFYVDPLLLLRLYRSIIEPLLTYCSICYYPALSVKNRNRLLEISHVSAKIIGLPTPKLTEIIDHAILKKARAVATESDHPLSTFFHVLPSQRRYRCIKCKTCRYSRSFVPVAIRMLNAKWVVLMSPGWIVLVVYTSGNSFAFCWDHPIYFRCDHEL